jgi:phage terminase small subunit
VSEKKLTPKQFAFVEEYLKDLNATQAAIRAGYSAKTAGQIGEENLRKPEIANAIEAAKQERSKRTKIDADWLLTRLADEVDADIADLYDESTGTLKPVHKWPKIFRQGLVAGIDVNQLNIDDKTVGEVVKIKLADRNAKLKMIGDHIGVQAFKQQLEHKVATTIGFRLNLAGKPN